MALLWTVIGLSTAVHLFIMWLVDSFVPERIAIIGSFVGIQRVENPGIAFGVQLPVLAQELLIGTAASIVFLVALKTAKTTLQKISFGLIIGGALGNIIDRAIDGTVTDYFQVGGFYLFNVADSCISIGVTVLLLENLMRSQKNPKNQTPNPK